MTLLSEEKQVLYCDNPQCRKPITGPEIAYNLCEREIYHADTDCLIFATVWKTLKDGQIRLSSCDYIDRQTTLTLLKEGKLNQSSSLEDKLK